MSIVVIKRCPEYDAGLIQQALEEAVALVGGWTRFVQRGRRVLLKPNLIAPRRPEQAACTHPEVLRALIRSLKAQGCEVAVGDSAGGAIAGIAPTAQALQVSGWAQVCAEEGATLVNFDREGALAVPSRTGRMAKEFHLARPVVEADVVINVPKLKTHSNGGYTGAVKNTFGCIPGLRKAEYHRIAPELADFAELIADIHLAARVTLNVLDGIVGMEGAGPTNGRPKKAGVLLVSPDALALDVVAARMIGLEPGRLEILQAAARLGVGESDLKAIKVAGDFTEPPRLDFALPPSVVRGRRMPRWLLPAIIAFFRTRPEIDVSRCRRCGICQESCPVKAVDRQLTINRAACIECLCCQELCPQGAVRLVRVHPVARLLFPPERMLRPN
ncbi:MAG: DUF362 domain-containing protein [Betaproteobacteria bacterium]